MEVLKVLVPCDDKLLTMDALRIEGTLWLVPRWIENPVERWREPVRTIRVPEDAEKAVPEGFPQDIASAQTLSIAVLEGRTSVSPLGEWIDVQEAPGIRVPLPRRDRH